MIKCVNVKIFKCIVSISIVYLLTGYDVFLALVIILEISFASFKSRSSSSVFFYKSVSPIISSQYSDSSASSATMQILLKNSALDLPLQAAL